jgi:hypothetical protein
VGGGIWRQGMSFFNSLSIRFPLAIIGGTLYGALTYRIVVLLNRSSELAIFGGIIVFLFYLGSRLLLLFSGIDSPYYSKVTKGVSRPPIETGSFYQTSQWVGKFYHYHDILLFIFLTVLSMTFLTSLIIDWSGKRPIGDTIQNLLSAFICLT